MKEISARKRIKKHLAKRGSEPVVLTERMVMYWWGVLNQAVFYGHLKKPTKISLIYMKSTFGWVVTLKNKRVRLTLLPKYKSREKFLNVLIHEMVHAWEHQYELNVYVTHGTKFMSWHNRIKRTTTLTLETRYARD